ncbi:MAG: hypothetical protein ACREKE_08855 [bacterium]
MRPEQYVPGVCNIGPAEIRSRRATGWGGLTASLALALVLFAFSVPALWRLAVFFPATLAATGFLQAAQGFCVGFGFKSAFNFGDRGATDSVIQAEFRAMDRKKAQKLLLQSLVIGAVAALLAYWI